MIRALWIQRLSLAELLDPMLSQQQLAFVDACKCALTATRSIRGHMQMLPSARSMSQPLAQGWNWSEASWALTAQAPR